MELHPLVQPLQLLIGTWQGRGQGNYPTIKAFEYLETVTFTAMPGKPFLRYEQRTKSTAGAPMHTELGFLRPIGNGRVEFVLAQPTGQTESMEGTLLIDEQGAVRISVESTEVTNTSTAKNVAATRREYEFSAADGRDGGAVDGGGSGSGSSEVAATPQAMTRFDMAAVGEEMQQHLVSRLTKQAE